MTRPGGLGRRGEGEVRTLPALLAGRPAAGGYSDADRRSGLGPGWVRLPGIRLYLGRWLPGLLALLVLTGAAGVWSVRVLAYLLGGGPLPVVTVVDAVLAAAVCLGLLVLHEAGHAAAVLALGGKVVRAGSAVAGRMSS